ncbi:MAG: hypothetical protein L3K19_05735 [Thermoplasmata archaeon]|nr:hypothetical protein [Thermoplasmata archaeon]
MGYGTTGFAAAVTLLMVLAPASAGGIHATKVYVPGYKHTVSQPNSYWSVSGCGKAKTSTAKWNAHTGTITTADSASGSTCGKSLGTVGGSGYASAQSGISVAVPFSVSSNGNHSVASAWSITLATSSSYTAGACPAKNVNYHPALYQYSYAECEAYTFLEFQVSGSVQDLSNSSWYGNYSYGFTYNETGWQNYTDCYNYGTPTCTNNSGPFGYHYGYGYNEAGFSAFSFSGTTGVTLWNNGTKMVKGHHYVLDLNIYVYASADAIQANLLGPWAGSAVAAINMATLGNGASLSSITVV